MGIQFVKSTIFCVLFSLYVVTACSDFSNQEASDGGILIKHTTSTLSKENCSLLLFLSMMVLLTSNHFQYILSSGSQTRG